MKTVGDPISPINITGAALIAQFSIIVIMFIGTAIAYEARYLYLYILLLTILSIGLLFFTDEFSKIWSPMLHKIYIPHLKWSTALLAAFIMNIGCTYVLVTLTGGSKNSPFTPLYFLFPALAIFLREPLMNIIIYVASVSFSFSIQMGDIYTDSNYKEANRNYGAFWFVSVACFLLTTFIGYVTRPQ